MLLGGAKDELDELLREGPASVKCGPISNLLLLIRVKKYVHDFLFQIEPLFNFILKESISDNFPVKVCFLAKTLSDFGSDARFSSNFCIPFFLFSSFVLMGEHKVHYQAKCKNRQHLRYHREIPFG